MQTSVIMSITTFKGYPHSNFPMRKMFRACHNKQQQRQMGLFRI